ncbi:MAG: bifunctional folylpolyglutamate synthase/dihydrofolate synthase [Candidatus Kapabacteria bacterium]|nr:bifunctional folylpolyglutamate synthase/dihydrofolate synthase [Candidatus Kapabacteria bacterium]
MDIQPILDKLFAMTFHAGIKPGLERIEDLCSSINNPHLRYPVIHVAGSNGKGSTCSILASILTCAGYKTALYTSPHISRFNERIRVDGVAISDEDIVRLASPLMEKAQENGSTFFEVTTAMAFQYFAERRVDVAIIETGLGGRLDATNICQPFLSIITQIDVDHTEYLGTTLEKIAGEKAGIIKQGAPVVIGHREPLPILRSVFESKAESVHTEIVFAEDSIFVELDAIHPDLTMTISVVGNDELRYYTTDLCGRHQTNNISTVLAAMPIIRTLYFVDDEHVREGLQSVKRYSGLYGRCQLISTDPFTVLDVSHNPGGIAALRETLFAAGRTEHSMQIVFGAMSDKDVGSMLNAIAPLAHTIHFCAPVIPRAMSVEELANLASSHGILNTTSHPSVSLAYSAARSTGPTVVCGSFHVADEVMVEHE